MSVVDTNGVVIHDQGKLIGPWTALKYLTLSCVAGKRTAKGSSGLLGVFLANPR